MQDVSGRKDQPQEEASSAADGWGDDDDDGDWGAIDDTSGQGVSNAALLFINSLNQTTNSHHIYVIHKPCSSYSQ